MFGCYDSLFPFCHLLLQLVFQGLVFFVELGCLGSTGGKYLVFGCNLCLEGFYLLLLLLHSVLQLAPLALALFALFVSNL